MKKPSKTTLRNKPKKIKHISLKSLRQKAWTLQSEYVRRSENGICYTCGVHGNWKEMQAGHYIHKDCLDYDLINIHCQCPRCNTYLSGNLGVYAERLLAEYGETALSDLRRRSQVIKKFGVEELENLIEKYEQLLQTLNST